MHRRPQPRFAVREFFPQPRDVLGEDRVPGRERDAVPRIAADDARTPAASRNSRYASS
ncbi:hypothetical protein ACGFMK_19950 [Amycolatopsis sp. NPDC049252]|uniref:hypothetical protein n=1 Tax=Amycolatopsis sp. NPDC049252 TaxID=3363933 RepID=UPI0037233746